MCDFVEIYKLFTNKKLGFFSICFSNTIIATKIKWWKNQIGKTMEFFYHNLRM